jgi:hypothetical protein
MKVKKPMKKASMIQELLKLLDRLSDKSKLFEFLYLYLFSSASKGSLGNLQKPPGGIALSGLGTTATTGGRSFGIPVMGNITQQSNRPVMV